MPWHSIQQTTAAGSRAFTDEHRKPEAVQETILKRILSTGAGTDFGRMHGFDDIHTIEAFRKRVPVRRYESYQPYIDRICSGASNVLTGEPVIAVESTGGSTGGAKYIPCTASSLQAYRSALFPWMTDLLKHRPGIMRGTAYWSISPALAVREQYIGVIQHGLPSDAAYFGADIAGSILETLAVPPETGSISDLGQWRLATLRRLLAADDLSFISVWSPTFIIELMQSLAGDFDGRQQLYTAGLSRKRIEMVRSAIVDGHIDTRMLWPRLDTISCWLDAGSQRYREKLALLFPGVYLQGKGLLATEAAVSIPLCGQLAPVLSLRSGFFEFENNGRYLLAHQLVAGEHYRLIMTTFSGLYRYDIGDRVRVEGHLESTPLIRFIGRDGATSDLCGEKLTDAFVTSQTRDIRGDAMLMPRIGEHRGYVLGLDRGQFTQSEAQNLVATIEQRLCVNPQYSYARRIGQLERLAALRVSHLWRRYTEFTCSSGRKLGDIKPAVLCLNTAFYEFIAGAQPVTGENTYG